MSLPLKQRAVLLTLLSELALLLVARGESDILTVLLLTVPDLTLYIEDAGMFVINGRKLPGTLLLISICRSAISKDFFESVLPNPEPSGDDFPVRLFWTPRWSSCFGGANFRMLTTLSTILFPICTGLTMSLLFVRARLIAGTELPLLWVLPCGALPLEGEHDCLLGLPAELGSTEEDLELGAPGLPLDADNGLSGIVVLKFGGASSENPGISEGFHGLDLTVGELPREGMGFFTVVGADLVTEGADRVTEEDRTGADTLDTFDGVDDRRVGVADLDVDFDGGIIDLEAGTVDLGAVLAGFEVCKVGLAVGVDDRAGVLDLAGGATGLAEGKVGLEVGVEGREALVVEVSVGRPVGVAGLDEAEPDPPDDEGLRVPLLEEYNPGDKVDCLDTKLLLEVGSA